MAYIVLAVIVGLALFQFDKSRRRLNEDLIYDAALHCVIGTAFVVLALVFLLGALLG